MWSSKPFLYSVHVWLVFSIECNSVTDAKEINEAEKGLSRDLHVHA